MPDLREQFERCFRGRVCLMGLGNVEYGDDGFGVRLVEKLKSEVRSPKSERSPKEVQSPKPGAHRAGQEARVSDFGIRTSGFETEHGLVVAGTTPDRFVGLVAQKAFDHLVFVDAVDFGGAPGSVILLNSEQMGARFPQISTHKISLGLLAKWVEANGTTRAWLLGVQPESLGLGVRLTPTLERTLDTLRQLVREAMEGVAA